MAHLLANDHFEWTWVNQAVTALITGGCYREALAFPERWPQDARRAGTGTDPNAWSLVEINLAEAEYNLGLVDDAFQRIERLIETIETADGPFGPRTPIEPIVINGTLTQRAWIAALRNDWKLGLEYVDAIEPDGLPAAFRAEVHYTRALLLNKAGRSHDAEAAAEAGWSQATRPSSQRNGLFLIGIILAERGDDLMAERAFERGAAHHYEGQGGEALLRFGQLLLKQDRRAEAQRVLRWCTERDPEHPAATVAANLLSELH